MNTRLKYPVDKSKIGFKNFLKFTLLECDDIISEFTRINSIHTIEPSDYAIAARIKELYLQFQSILTKPELEAVWYLRFSENKTSIKPGDYDETIQTVFNKWKSIYFSRGIPTVYKRIDYKLLGLHLKSFRKERSLTRDCTARCCGINNRTLENYEKGKTPPSLDFINVFCQIVCCSFDELLQKSIRKKIF